MVLLYARKPAPDSSAREVSLEPSKPQKERTQLSQEMQKGPRGNRGALPCSSHLYRPKEEMLITTTTELRHLVYNSGVGRADKGSAVFWVFRWCDLSGTHPTLLLYCQHSHRCRQHGCIPVTLHPQKQAVGHGWQVPGLDLDLGLLYRKTSSEGQIAIKA